MHGAEFGFRVWFLGFRAGGLGFRGGVSGSGVWGPEFGAYGVFSVGNHPYVKHVLGLSSTVQCGENGIGPKSHRD